MQIQKEITTVETNPQTIKKDDNVENNNNYRKAKDVNVSYANKVFYTNLKIATLEWVFTNIKSDVWKERIEKVRAEKDNDARKKLKSDTLMYFNIGTFKDNKRSNANFLSSEFMIFDFDHVEGDIILKKNSFKENKNVYAVFISPSGDGLKVITRLDSVINSSSQYSRIYKHYAKVFGATVGEKADKTSDASRPCFISHDPDLYVNENAEPLNTNLGEVYYEEDPHIQTPAPTGPLSEEQIVVSDNVNLWEGVSVGQRTNRRGQLIGILLNKGVSQKITTDILLMYNDRCTPPEDKKKIVSEVADYYKRYAKVESEFWEIKTNNNGDKYAFIKDIKLFNTVESAGFGKIYKDKSNYIIKVENKIMDTATIPQIKDFLRAIVEGRRYSEANKNLILEKLVFHTGGILSDSSMEYLKTYDSLVKRDSKDKANLYYRNCFVQVDKTRGAEVKEYSQLDGIIWKSQILQRDFKLLNSGEKKSDFEIFLRNVMRGDLERFNAIKSAIGYLVHDYKNPVECKAVVLNDEKISDNPNGRTGKSIIGKAIQKMRKSARIDGKNFKFDRFCFQMVELDTKVMDFNDVTKNFDFEKLFSIVTDELNVEKKNLPSFSLSFDESPKILISTNFTLKGEGASYRARMFELEFSDFYNDKHTPLNDFGKTFFDEWDEQEWLLFDNFMIHCVQFYLQNGLVETDKINLNKRKIINNTNPSFVSFMEAHTEIINIRTSKHDFYLKFQRENDDFDNLKKNTFTKWLKSYAAFASLEYIEEKSNSSQYFTLKQ